MKNLVALFEQTAAQRAADAHRNMVVGTLRSAAGGCEDLEGPEHARTEYSRAEARHEKWFSIRLEAEGLN
jgi:hypothetical protein